MRDLLILLTAVLALGCDSDSEAPPPASAPSAKEVHAKEAHDDKPMMHGDKPMEHGDAMTHSAPADAAVVMPEGASVRFVSPADGATVTSPFTVVMGVSGITVEPAGEAKEGSGHHHIIIDGTGPEAGGVVPADETHIHYGKGQTETELTLTPGKHTLTLQFANGLHQSYGPNLSQTITVEVVEE